MTKLESLIENLNSAVDRLEEALNEEKNDFLRDASIQRFEFTFELAWKSLKTALEENSLQTFGAKSVLREAGRLGLVSDVTAWFKFLEARNLTSHTYDLSTAEQVYDAARKFVPFVRELLHNLSSKY